MFLLVLVLLWRTNNNQESATLGNIKDLESMCENTPYFKTIFKNCLHNDCDTTFKILRDSTSNLYIRDFQNHISEKLLKKKLI